MVYKELLPACYTLDTITSRKSSAQRTKHLESRVLRTASNCTTWWRASRTETSFCTRCQTSTSSTRSGWLCFQTYLLSHMISSANIWSVCTLQHRGSEPDRHDCLQQHRLLHCHGQLQAGSADRVGVAEREDLPQPTRPLQHCALHVVLARWHAARNRRRWREGTGQCTHTLGSFKCERYDVL